MEYIRRLIRKKVLSAEDVEDTGLDRCLSTLDLIGLGIGSTLGAGLYVVAGEVAHNQAGPGVILSFLVAALASALAGCCYAEFAARIPRAGSAYVYSYVTVGEFMAFIIGWNLILEYVIGSASVARGWSVYFDALIDHRMSNAFNQSIHMDVSQLSDYPDFFAFGITILVTVLLCAGVKESTRFNSIFTCINLLVVVYVTICGFFKIDWNNWNLSENLPKHAGSGGFLPFGFPGVMAGAATCFYAFVGFDVVATTGEETKNPQRSIPIGIVVSLIIIFLSYFFTSAVVTLMCPYYLLDPNSPLPFVFDRVGWHTAKYIISVGALCGLSTSLLGGMFPMPRILYAMGSDGLIFRFLAKIHPRLKTPLTGTIVAGVFAGTMAMLFNLQELIEMLSIGTLLAYTLVAICVLILRYEADANLGGHLSRGPDELKDISTFEEQERFSWKLIFGSNSTEPTILTARITKILVAVMCVFITFFFVVVIFFADYLEEISPWAIIMTTVFGLAIVICLFLIWRQPMSQAKLHFKVPLVPFSPAISAMINIYLMLKLHPMTWVRFGVWMVIGLTIYFTYGIRESSEGKKLKAMVFDHDQDKVQGEGHRSSSVNAQSDTVAVHSPSIHYHKDDDDDSIVDSDVNEQSKLLS